MKNTEELKPLWLKDREVGLLLGVSRTTIWQLVKTMADFPKPFKFGCSTRWKAEEVYQFAENFTEQSK